MEPIQTIPESPSEEILVKQTSYLRLAAAGIFILCFAAGVLFSLAYFAPVPIADTHQTASAAEVLRAQNAFTTVSLVAQSAIVYDIDTGAVLYERNAGTQLPLASITKVALALAASEVLVPDSVVTIPRDTSYNSKASQLLAGERFRTDDLMTYTLVASSNDGADMIAEAANEPLQVKYPQAGSEATIWRMNNLASSLGLSSMYFLNATGLDESLTQSGAYGSAYDVAKLFGYAVKSSPDLFAGTATTAVQITSLEGHVARATNTDEALDSIPGAIMGKTGLTDLAGGNLAVIFAANGKRYAAVVLGSTEMGRFSDIRQLAASTRNIQP